MQNLRWQRQEMMQIRYHKNEPLVGYTAFIGAGQKGGTWPNVRPTPVGANFADLDGLTPRGYTNPDTGASF